MEKEIVIEIINCKISGTMLGIEDHGILSAFVYLEWPSAGIGFGGYGLDGMGGKKPSKACGLFVRSVLEVIGVSDWEKLKGQPCRVKIEGGWGGRAVALGNFMEEKWFAPKEAFAALKGDE